MDRIFSTLVRLMAPVLSFTAEELWSYRKEGVDGQSVFLMPFPEAEKRYIDSALE